MFHHEAHHDRVRIAEHEDPVALPAQVEQHVELVLRQVEQETAQRVVDRLRVDRASDFPDDRVVEIFGADLPAFELQQHAGLFVRIDEFGGVHTADLFEFADGRFDAVIGSVRRPGRI